MNAAYIIDELVNLKNPEKAHILQRFLKPVKGNMGKVMFF
jgi:hypothetical protein